MGSSGGGGSSGAVTHSAYLESVHADWLNATGVDKIEKSITEVMDSALGSSPWTAAVSYDPSADVAAFEAEMAAFKVLLSGLSDTVNWAALYAQAGTTLDGVAEVALTADAASFAAILDDNINTVALPRFRRGMQDVNAVVSSAFVVGEAVIEGMRDRDVAKYLSALRITVGERKLAATEQMVNMMARRVAWNAEYVRTYTEAERIKIVAMKEKFDGDHLIDESDAKWDLEVFQFGANVMAASAGGTSTAGIKGVSKAQSAIGGAMMGGAAGAMIAGASSGAITGPVGMGVGAVLGLASGFL